MCLICAEFGELVKSGNVKLHYEKKNTPNCLIYTLFIASYLYTLL